MDRQVPLSHVRCYDNESCRTRRVRWSSKRTRTCEHGGGKEQQRCIAKGVHVEMEAERLATQMERRTDRKRNGAWESQSHRGFRRAGRTRARKWDGNRWRWKRKNLGRRRRRKVSSEGRGIREKQRQARAVPAADAAGICSGGTVERGKIVSHQCHHQPQKPCSRVQDSGKDSVHQSLHHQQGMVLGGSSRLWLCQTLQIYTVRVAGFYQRLLSQPRDPGKRPAPCGLFNSTSANRCRLCRLVRRKSSTTVYRVHKMRQEEEKDAASH